MLEIISSQNGLNIKEFSKVALGIYDSVDCERRRYDAPFYYAPVRRALLCKRFGMPSKIEPFLVRRDGKPVACVASIHAPSKASEQDGYFGFFETIDDPEVAASMLSKMEIHFRGLDVRRIIGPVCPDLNEFPGILIEGHDAWCSPHTAYNHRYYARILEDLGYSKAKDLVAITANIDADYDILKAAKKRSISRGIKLSAIKGAEAFFTLSRAWPVYVEAHRHNWEEVPITSLKFVSDFMLLANLCPPGFFQIATYRGKVIGFGAAIPDTTAFEGCLGATINPLEYKRAILSVRAPKNVRVPLLCVTEKFRNRGVDAAIMHELWRFAKLAGVEKGEFSWILEDNQKMIGPLLKIGGNVTKVWRVFAKEIKLS